MICMRVGLYPACPERAIHGEVRTFGVRAELTLSPLPDSKRVLPSIYNSAFDKQDLQARELLEDLKLSSPSGKRK